MTKPVQNTPWDYWAYWNNPANRNPTPMPDNISQRLANTLIQALKKADLETLPHMKKVAESVYTAIQLCGGDLSSLKAEVDPIFDLSRNYLSMKREFSLEVGEGKEVDEELILELKLKELKPFVVKREAKIKPLEDQVREKESEIERIEDKMAYLKVELILLGEEKQELERQLFDRQELLRSGVNILNKAFKVEHALSIELEQIKSASHEKKLEVVEALISDMLHNLQEL